jgi:serine/threonine-protein kinase
MNVGPESAEGESKIVGICATCGRPLTQVGPKGECLRCLADLGFLSGSQEPGKSHIGRRLTPGPLKYDHFEVEVGADGFPVELGAGAMAVTYRARDTVLNSVVALKVIERNVAQNPGARSRFLREARAAAQIHHPNVARVSHYGEQGGECFYVMELVEGETLEAIVRREGPMPIAQALEVIDQTARALAAAEACGVVHRDIKPSNIMLERDPGGDAPIVKVIDYGIAKILDPEAEPGAELTQTGFIGTPAFASPEQFAPSEQMKIDTRSDIYSLGATFWYLLSGRVPFVGRTLQEVAAKQADELPLEQLKNSHVPARVIALLRSMLAVDPAKRLQTARELLSAIHRCSTKFSTEARARRRRFMLASAGAIAVVVAIATGTWLYQRGQSSAEIERSIAVLPFGNLSANGEDAYFAVGMQEEITGDLAKLAGMKVIGTQSTRSYLPGKERNLHAIGRDLGVRHLLEGTVSRDHDQVRIALRLVDLRDGAISWAETYQRPLREIFTLQSEITHSIAAQLQARFSPNEKAAVDTPPTTDLRAYDLYLQARAIPIFVLGIEMAEQFANGKRAIAMLNEAIGRDPSFVLAYCGLAGWHDEIYWLRTVGPPEEQTVDHRSLAESALEKARRLQPDSADVHLALAEHALFINLNVDEADIQIQQALQSLPNNAQVEQIAGRVARRQDRWDEAVRHMERSISLEPRDIAARGDLAETYVYMRRYQDTDRVFESMLALAPPDKYPSLPIDRASAQFEYSADITPVRQAVATQMAAHLLDDRSLIADPLIVAIFSRDAAAISRVLSTKHAPIAENGMIFPDAWFEALAARLRGDNSAALNAFRAARPQMEESVRADPARGTPLSFLAMIDAGLGRAEQAVEEGKRACELSSFKINNLDAVAVRTNLAVVYAWIGQNDLAIGELSKLVDRPSGGNEFIGRPSYGDFRTNPLWDPLRSDPRFETLVQRLAPTAAR